VDNESKIKRILFVQQELTDWKSARAWGYNFHIGLEEGFAANGIEVTTLLSSWFPVARRLCAAKQFDQVWINDVIHMFEPKGWRHYRLTMPDLEWLATLAPIRLGFVIESLKYTDNDYREAPFLSNYPNILKKTLPYLTHVMAIDENDIECIRDVCDIPVTLLVPPVPYYNISRTISLPPTVKPVFRGSPYGERAKWLKIPFIKELLDHQLNYGNDGDLPEIFDRLHRYLYPQAIQSDNHLIKLYDIYLDSIRKIRRQSFEIYLNDLRQGGSVVNLPSYGKVFTGRVYEGMAAGRPVITSKYENRPRMNALFEDDRDILLFPPDQPEIMAQQIRKVMDNPDFGRVIATNAMHKMLNFHTTEKRVCQILEWIATGREADFDTILPENDFKPMQSNQTLDIAPQKLLEQFESGFKKQLTPFNFFKYELFRLKRNLYKLLQRIEAMVRKLIN